jgi:hypothetical protein
MFLGWSARILLIFSNPTTSILSSATKLLVWHDCSFLVYLGALGHRLLAATSKNLAEEIRRWREEGCHVQLDHEWLDGNCKLHTLRLASFFKTNGFTMFYKVPI